MGPVCLIKLSRKQKMLWALGFFLEFFSQLISTTGSWDRLPVHLATMGPVCLMKLNRKWKLVRTLGFFLDFSPSSYWLPEAEIGCLRTWWPRWPWDQCVWWNWPENKSWSDHLFFLDFFPPAHFVHWKLRQQVLKSFGWVVGAPEIITSALLFQNWDFESWF